MRNMTREEQARKILDAILIAPPRADEIAHVAACLMEIAVIEREEERGVCAKIAEDRWINANDKGVVKDIAEDIATRIKERRIS